MARKKDHAVRREDMARAAFRVIARDGITGATIREVAREAGCLPGLLTHYIRTMDELLLAAAEYAAAQSIREWEPLEKQYQGEQALREAIKLLLPLDKEHTDRWKIWISFWDVSRKSPAIRKVLTRFRKDMIRSYGRMIETAQQAGDLPVRIDPRFAAQDLIALVTGLAIAKVLDSPAISAANQLKHVDRWLAHLKQPD